MQFSSDETINIKEITRESLEISIDRRERSIDHLIFPGCVSNTRFPGGGIAKR